MVSVDPWYIAGYTDAEGSFNVSVIPRGSSFVVTIAFEIGSKDKLLLESIRNTLGVGSVYYLKSGLYRLKISNLDSLDKVIIPFFKIYPLVTQKYGDFLLFTKIVNILITKQHLTLKGIQEIVNIKASMNKGLGPKLLSQFSNINPVTRPNIKFHGVPNPFWVVGFVEGDGSFIIRIYDNKRLKLGKDVSLNLKVTQHSRDREMLFGLVNYFGCGKVIDRKAYASDYIVRSKEQISSIIVPFFSNYCFIGFKGNDFNKFKEISNIMINNKHLSEQGLNEIIHIKNDKKSN